MDTNVRVLVANRPRLMRELVLSTLSEQTGIRVVGEAKNEHDVPALVAETKPDFLLIALDESLQSAVFFARKWGGRGKAPGGWRKESVANPRASEHLRADFNKECAELTEKKRSRGLAFLFCITSLRPR